MHAEAERQLAAANFLENVAAKQGHDVSSGSSAARPGCTAIASLRQLVSGSNATIDTTTGTGSTGAFSREVECEGWSLTATLPQSANLVYN
jgi:hypothetical protein